MRNIKYYILSTVLLVVLNACGGTSPKSKEKENTIIIDTKSISLRVLGTTQEWQKEPVQKSWSEANSYCESLELEENSNWRLPTSKEFFALLDTNESMDTHFPTNSTIKEFWSSSETSFDNKKAWKISTWSNSEFYADKNTTLGVRCISGETLSTHTFTIENNNIKDVDNSGSELLWQDDTNTQLKSWQEAKTYCETKDQRLPTIFELQNVIDKKNLNNPFSNVNNENFTAYWSDTPIPTNKNQVLTVNFNTGGVSFSDKTTQKHVRCVETLDTIAPVIILNGASPMVVNYNSDYTDFGAIATDNKDKNITVYSIGTVDTSKIGNYTIIYTATDKAGNSATILRTVNVVDTQIPVITLNGNSVVTVNVGSSYSNGGAFATDNVDGDNLAVITAGDTVNPNAIGTYVVTYNFTDSSNNPALEVTRTVNVVDAQIPVITLNGNSVVTVNVGSSYSDGGASATDNVDGDISSSISTINPVDANFVGTYTVAYNVSDSSGNSALEVTRTVNVVDIPINAVDDNYTTSQSSDKILDVLQNDINTTTIISVTTPAEGKGNTINNSNQIDFIVSDAFSYLREGEEINATFTYTAENPARDQSTANVTVTVTGLDNYPDADITGDHDIFEGGSITFDGSSSSDPDHDTSLSYQWKIDNIVQVSTTNTLTKNDFNAGDYNITLIVTDDTGLTDSSTVNIIVSAIVEGETLLPKTGDSTFLATNDDSELQKGMDYSYTRDNTTDIVTNNSKGLMWMDDTNNSTNRYSWSNAGTYCQNLDYDSYEDWRLPNVQELYYLNNWGSSNPSIINIFNNTGTDVGYWTVSNGTNLILLERKIWVAFNDIKSEQELTANQKYVRCVRGTEFVLTLTRDNGREVVIDTKHKLQWHDDSNVNSSPRTWSEAMTYCQDSTLGEENDWRVPNINELYSIVDTSNSPKMHSIFNNGASNIYWSSTGLEKIVTIDFSKGIDNQTVLTDNKKVRCVRDIQ